MVLPEKGFFSLDELAKRWEAHAVDVGTFLEYARQDLLVFSVHLPDVGSHQKQWDTPEGRVTRTVQSITIFTTGEEKSPIWYLSAVDATRILSAPADLQVAVNGLYPRAEREHGSGHYHCSPKYFTAKDLVVTKAERDRFELKYGLVQTTATPEAALSKVLALSRRFPAAVAYAQRRYADRSKHFDMADEYDMQDLMGTLLKATFDNVTAEDHVPMVAGRRTRIDFVLSSDEIVIELKMTREGLSDKEVGDQLTQDIVRYQKHPNCKTLVCVVYDPLRKIRNDAGLENDLSGASEKCDVHVLVVR